MATEQDAKTWNMLCHLSALAALVGIPFGNILGPLLVWQLKKNEIPSVEAHGKAALNFQITATLAGIVAALTLFVLVGFVLVPAVIIAWLIFTILAGIKANSGEAYSYPFSLNLVK